MFSKEKAVELFIECWSVLDRSDKVEVHNIYARENDPDDEIFENTEDFLDENFSSPSEAVRAATYGDYRYTDDYVWFNGLANLESSDYDLPFEDVNTLAEWFIEEDNIGEIDYMDDFADFVEYMENGGEEEDEDEEEE